MTLVYIGLPSRQLTSYRIAIGKAVQQGLHAAFDLTPKKRLRILTEWAPEEPAIDLPHFGLSRRESTVLVVVVLGRPSLQNQRSEFLSTIAKEVEARAAIHPLGPASV